MRTNKRGLQQHFKLEIQEFKPILEKPEEVAKAKAYARIHCGWFHHELGSWKKWVKEEIGGTLGWIRVAKCLKCKQKIYIHAQGTMVGYLREMPCPKDPNRNV